MQLVKAYPLLIVSVYGLCLGSNVCIKKEVKMSLIK